MSNRSAELASCGVYCGACPSFKKTCLGCPSESQAQKRRSKWGCKIRKCCYETQGLDYCIECEEYPCAKVHKKLFAAHQGDPRYNYRFEIPKRFPILLEMGLEAYLGYLRERYTCPACGDLVHFYQYSCRQCGSEYIVPLEVD